MNFNERHSDVGNAKWFVRLHGSSIRFVHELQRWIVLQGSHWQEDCDGDLERMAKQAIDAMIANLSDVPQTAREGLFRHVLRSEGAARIAALLSLAQSEPGITIPQAALDADPWLLGVQRGAVDLRTGKFLIPAPAAYVTKQAGCEYRPHATCPTWCAFLDRILDGDIRMIEFLQRAVGYSLTGSTREQCLFILHGKGSNGKSKLVGALRGLLGDYARECATETLLAKRDAGGINNDIARLAGARLVSAIETEDGKRFAESLVKALTGGDAITARFLHREFFEFVPTFKLWLATNHKPTIRGNDHAIWRRIRLLPFNVQIPDAEQDQDLADKLAAEYPGILNWAIAGCLAWQRDGLQTPEPVKAATAGYRADMDRLGQWIAERCILSPTAKVQAKFAYNDYRQWAEERGETALSFMAFGTQLTERDIQKEKGRLIWYVGIGLCDATATPATPDSGFPGFSNYSPSREEKGENDPQVSQVSQTPRRKSSRKWRGSHRSARPPSDEPIELGDRPVQLPLLLPMRRERK